VSQQEWHHSTVNPLLIPLNDQNTIAPYTDVLQARSLMTRTGNTRLIVMANNRLVGIVALKNLLTFLLLTIDFEENR
jgi:CBS domain-containing protein